MASSSSTSYRFIIYPTNPAANYVVQNHQLKFAHDFQPRTYQLFGNVAPYSLHQQTTYFFDVKAAFASTYHDILSFFKARKLSSFDPSKCLVIELDKAYFDKAQINHAPYSEKQANFNQHDINIQSLSLQRHCLSDEYAYSYTLPEITNRYPVYAQSINCQFNYDGDCLSNGSTLNKNQFNIEDKDAINKHKRLLKGMNIEKYDSPHGKKDTLGQDFYIAYNAPVRAIGYRRSHHGAYDWCTSQHHLINKKSYLKLTQTLNNDNTKNADKIAQLFLDYAGFKFNLAGFLHLQLFRHKQNIHKAVEIANFLTTKEAKQLNNADIASYLVKQYEALSKEHHIFKYGSFARRMNYAIMQLTDGLCQTVQEYVEKDQPQPSTSISCTKK